MVDKEKFKERIKTALSEKSYDTTYWLQFGTDAKRNQWAFVLGWLDDYEDNEYHLNLKIAYVPSNSLMHEYYIDWIMPYDEKTEEVDDTQTTIDEADVTDLELNFTVEWFIKEAYRMIKEYGITEVNT